MSLIKWIGIISTTTNLRLGTFCVTFDKIYCDIRLPQLITCNDLGCLK